MQVMRGVYGSARELYNDRGATDPPHITKFWFHKQTGNAAYEWSDGALNTYAADLKQNHMCLPIVENVKYPRMLWEKKGDQYEFRVQVQLHKKPGLYDAILFAKQSDNKVGFTIGGIGGVKPWEFRMQANFGSPYGSDDDFYVCRPSPTQQGADAEREKRETMNVEDGNTNILWQMERDRASRELAAVNEKIQQQQSDVQTAKDELEREQRDVQTAKDELARENEEVENAKYKLAQEETTAKNVEKTGKKNQASILKILANDLSAAQELKAEQRQDAMFASKEIRTFTPSTELQSLLNSGSRAYYRALALGQTVDGSS